MAHKLTNQTEGVIAARLTDAEGWIVVEPGDSVEFDDPRLALMAAEYGLTLEDKAAAIEAQDVPVTEGETRHTGGRQHRADDPRTLPAGTPVEETGDPGSTVPDEVLTSTGAEAINPVGTSEHFDEEREETEGEPVEPAGVDPAEQGEGTVAAPDANVYDTNTGEQVVEPGVAFDVDTASAAELKAYVEANSIEVTGTGEQGRVVKTDLIAAIKAARGDA